MTTVTIVSEPTEARDVVYRAIAGAKHSVGKTAGEALDAIASALPPDESSTLVLVQNFRPDRFFTAERRERLRKLTSLWRHARDQGTTLRAAEQAELDELIEAESKATSNRVAMINGDNLS